MRGRRSTVVESVSQGERTVAQSESVANYNHCHAITVQYFEVLRHLLVRHRLVDVQECLFVPLKMSRFTMDKALRWQEQLVRGLRDRSLFGGFAAIDRIMSAYEGSDLPEGMYADEDINHLSGDLTLRFQFVAPESEEFEAALWAWYTHPFGRSLFGMQARDMFDSLHAAREGFQRAFQQSVAPKLARRIANALELRAVTASNPTGTLLPVDLTLTSEYRHDTPLNVTVRIGELPSGIARKDITAIRITGVDSEALPTGSRILVDGGRLAYRTDSLSGYLFRDSRIRNDLTDTDEVLLHTPLNRREQREPREEDKELKRRLLEHLNDHIEYYHKVIWYTMSPDRRYMMLDGFIAPNSGGRSLASVVDNQLVGIIGNSLVMPVARGIRLDPTFRDSDETSLLDHYRPTVAEDPLRLALPTKGVYAEAVMGACNSCEHKEEDRFWRWEESPIPDSPAAIEPISTETRRAEPPDLTAAPTSTPIVAMQNAPAAPDPQGLAAALQLLSNPNLFRDITGLEGNQRNALEALKSSLEAAQQFGAEAADVAKTFGQYATNLGMQSATSQDMDRIQRSIQTARSQGLIDDQQASDLTHSALRGMVGQGAADSSDPRAAQAMLDTIRGAHDDGNIDDSQRRDLAEQVLGNMANDGEHREDNSIDRSHVQQAMNQAAQGADVEVRDGRRGMSINPSSAGSQSFDITVSGTVLDIRQARNNQCWAAAAAILLSWRLARSLSAREAAEFAGDDADGTSYAQLYDANRSLDDTRQSHFTTAIGLQALPYMSLPITEYRRLLEEHGPLWIQLDRTPNDPLTTHFVVVYGIYGDGDPDNTFLRIMDPWEGARTQRFDSYISDYERLAFEASEAFERELPLLQQIAFF